MIREQIYIFHSAFLLKKTGAIDKKVSSDFPGETFRVLKKKEEKQYGEYRTRRLIWSLG